MKYTVIFSYRIAGKFGAELNLAVWRIDQPTAKLKLSPSHTFRKGDRASRSNLVGVVFGLEQ
jgi:hypothetical protein